MLGFLFWGIYFFCTTFTQGFAKDDLTVYYTCIGLSIHILLTYLLNPLATYCSLFLTSKNNTQKATNLLFFVVVIWVILAVTFSFIVYEGFAADFFILKGSVSFAYCFYICLASFIIIVIDPQR